MQIRLTLRCRGTPRHAEARRGTLASYRCRGPHYTVASRDSPGPIGQRSPARVHCTGSIKTGDVLPATSRVVRGEHSSRARHTAAQAICTKNGRRPQRDAEHVMRRLPTPVARAPLLFVREASLSRYPCSRFAPPCATPCALWLRLSSWRSAHSSVDSEILRWRGCAMRAECVLPSGHPWHPF